MHSSGYRLSDACRTRARHLRNGELSYPRFSRIREQDAAHCTRPSCDGMPSESRRIAGVPVRHWCVVRQLVRSATVELMSYRLLSRAPHEAFYDLTIPGDSRRDWFGEGLGSDCVSVERALFLPRVPPRCARVAFCFVSSSFARHRDM